MAIQVFRTDVIVWDHITGKWYFKNTLLERWPNRFQISNVKIGELDIPVYLCAGVKPRDVNRFYGNGKVVYGLLEMLRHEVILCVEDYELWEKTR